MSFLAAITTLSPLVSNGISFAHDILKRKQPGREKDLEKVTLEKIELESRIAKTNQMNPSKINTVQLEDMYAKVKELDEKIVMYQKLANNELERMLGS